ncbi:Helix-turn-helix domain-containing protein [Chryseobacterium wanjuense]|uniref:Helix-turn-helix domain-containing protein n=1 Tax=Chryseobacterium wanjuense TaxID=356305 RepID=A0A1I0Q6J2_9FLAO|nr:helix-turn-helix transcriptional regulator [Chryseobacterium wanjuense]SEW22550.1 Helix-turn-helix domain-containing protein [Chryseobacterium wanjuense]
MKSANASPQKFNSISELHKALGFPKPVHPLVSLINYADIKTPADELPKALLLNFYKVSYKKSLTAKIKYGQSHYDFNEGGLSFVSPNQVIQSAGEDKDYSGYTLLFHPDFIRDYPLGAKIKTFGFFSYSANEALLLSDKEKQTVFSVFDNIKEELTSSMDDFSQDLVVSHIEVLFNYSNRFYKRQFSTRIDVNNDLLTRMEQILNNYFKEGQPLERGLPTVEYLGEQLHVSPRYLSDMLRSFTGRSAQQHIHDTLIDKAKEYLTSTNLSVSQIAYEIGFEHSQSFSKLFKKKTNLTPLQFKQSFH